MPPPFVPHTAREFGVGEILSRAFAVLRARPGLMFVPAFAILVVTQAIQLAITYPWLDDVQRSLSDPTMPVSEFRDLALATFLVAGVGLLLQLVSRAFLAGVLTHVVAATVVGERPTFAATWARVRPRLLPLIGLIALYTLTMFGAILLVVILAVLAPALGVLAGIGALVVGVWLLILFSLATPALVLENVGVVRAFGRSRWLIRGFWWRVFGVTVLAGLLGLVVVFFVSLPFELAGGGYALPTATTEPVTLTTNYLLLSSIGVVVGGTLAEPFIAAVTVLLYTNQRIRRENFVLPIA